jgi:hypothetical protein
MHGLAPVSMGVVRVNGTEEDDLLLILEGFYCEIMTKPSYWLLLSPSLPPFCRISVKPVA